MNIISSEEDSLYLSIDQGKVHVNWTTNEFDSVFYLTAEEALKMGQTLVKYYAQIIENQGN